MRLLGACLRRDFRPRGELPDAASLGDPPAPGATAKDVPHEPHSPHRSLLVLGVVLTICLSAIAAGDLASAPAVPATAHVSGAAISIPLGRESNYRSYLDGDNRTNDAGPQGWINMSTAPNLRPLWSRATGGPVWAQPIVVDGKVYVGSSDGYEYAYDATNGTFLWRTYLGVDSATPVCGGTPGVTSTATDFDGRVYVSGGNSVFYALNASDGRVVWKLPIAGGDANARGYYLWSSPLIYHDSAYVGIASQCDVPMVPGGLERISLITHREIDYFNASAPDPNGSSIWGSPSVNTATNTVYVTTGNPYRTNASTYSESIVSLNASTLAVLHSWQVPSAQAIPDGDFGVTPTLFTLPNGIGVVSAENKNGWLYEWYQSNLTLVWEDQLSTQGNNHYSTAEAFETIYAVAHGATVGGASFNSSVTAINPTNGAYRWQVTTKSSPGGGYAAPLVIDHLLVVPMGLTLYVLKAKNGQVLYKDSPGGTLVPPASVSRREIFVGAGDDLRTFDVALGSGTTHSQSTGYPRQISASITGPTGDVPACSYRSGFGGCAHPDVRDSTYLLWMAVACTPTLRVTDLPSTFVRRALTARIA
jgi:outer membrane protein assembly factor BamB